MPAHRNSNLLEWLSSYILFIDCCYFVFVCCFVLFRLFVGWLVGYQCVKGQFEIVGNLEILFFFFFVKRKTHFKLKLAGYKLQNTRKLFENIFCTYQAKPAKNKGLNFVSCDFLNVSKSHLPIDS